MKQYNLNEIANEAVCLGKITQLEAVNLGKRLVEKLLGNSAASNLTIVRGRLDPNDTWYLRHYYNDFSKPWVVSNYADSSGGRVNIRIIPLDAIEGAIAGVYETVDAREDTHNGYTVGKYYIYKKNGTAPKKGHKTYEDAKAEINRIRTANVNDQCKDFMIFKCVGINYAELKYKEIRGEE